MNVSAVSVCALNAAPYYHNKFFLNILLSFVSHLISDTSELGSQLDGE